MKILKTDKPEKPNEKEPEVIDKTKDQETIPQKKSSNGILWAIVGLLALVGIYMLVNYIKKQKENG